MIMESPATILRKQSRPVAFKDCATGTVFECNGNLWTKRSTRTAVGVWPACLPAWSYFGQNEIVHAARKPHNVKGTDNDQS